MVADALVSGDAEIARLRSTLGDAASRSSHHIVDLARALVAVPNAYPPGNPHAVADRIEAVFAGSGARSALVEQVMHVRRHTFRTFA